RFQDARDFARAIAPFSVGAAPVATAATRAQLVAPPPGVGVRRVTEPPPQTGASNHALALEAFSAAIRRFNEGRYAEAAERFAAARSLDPTITGVSDRLAEAQRLARPAPPVPPVP